MPEHYLSRPRMAPGARRLFTFTRPLLLVHCDKIRVCAIGAEGFADDGDTDSASVLLWLDVFFGAPLGDCRTDLREPVAVFVERRSIAAAQPLRDEGTR